ncbi:MAG: hypothetical protein V4612_04235 [Pseudomonadota bacterium]
MTKFNPAAPRPSTQRQRPLPTNSNPKKPPVLKNPDLNAQYALDLKKLGGNAKPETFKHLSAMLEGENPDLSACAEYVGAQYGLPSQQVQDIRELCKTNSKLRLNNLPGFVMFLLLASSMLQKTNAEDIQDQAASNSLAGRKSSPEQSGALQPELQAVSSSVRSEKIPEASESEKAEARKKLDDLIEPNAGSNAFLAFLPLVTSWLIPINKEMAFYIAQSVISLYALTDGSDFAEIAATIQSKIAEPVRKNFIDGIPEFTDEDKDLAQRVKDKAQDLIDSGLNKNHVRAALLIMQVMSESILGEHQNAVGHLKTLFDLGREFYTNDYKNFGLRKFDYSEHLGSVMQELIDKLDPELKHNITKLVGESGTNYQYNDTTYPTFLDAIMAQAEDLKNHPMPENHQDASPEMKEKLLIFFAGVTLCSAIVGTCICTCLNLSTTAFAAKYAYDETDPSRSTSPRTSLNLQAANQNEEAMLQAL